MSQQIIQCPRCHTNRMQMMAFGMMSSYADGKRIVDPQAGYCEPCQLKDDIEHVLKQNELCKNIMP